MAGRNPSRHTRVKRKLVSLRWVTFKVWVILIMLAAPTFVYGKDNVLI